MQQAQWQLFTELQRHNMAPTYELIASNSLTTTATSVTFSSIPSTYTDLIIKLSARKDNTNTLFYVRFNGDSSTLYSETSLIGDGGGGETSSGTSGVAQWNPRIALSNESSDTFSNSEMFIPNYTASQDKVGNTTDVTENNGTTAYQEMSAQLYRSNTAISSIEFSTVSGNFVSGSSFWLYGIKNS